MYILDGEKGLIREIDEPDAWEITAKLLKCGTSFLTESNSTNSANVAPIDSLVEIWPEL